MVPRVRLHLDSHRTRGIFTLEERSEPDEKILRENGLMRRKLLATQLFDQGRRRKEMNSNRPAAYQLIRTSVDRTLSSEENINDV